MLHSTPPQPKAFPYTNTMEVHNKKCLKFNSHTHIYAIHTHTKVKGLSGLSLKALTLISFRDVVLLKTSITG